MTTSKSNILLINRDKPFCDKATSFLQRTGYEVHTATSMRGALSVLAGHPVGLILCDTDLEDINGLDFLSFIKKDPLREKIPVIFLVSIKNQGRPFKAFELGAVDYLVYPLSSLTLFERIKEVFPPAKQQPSVKEEPPQPPPVQAEKPPVAAPEPAVEPAEETTPPTAPAAPKQNLPTPVNVDLSRDGVIWMPSKLKAYNNQNITVESSLFGKKGVSLIIRFKKPEGIFVLYGRINDIVFKDFQSPSDIDIALEANDAWRQIHTWLNQISGNVAAACEFSEPEKETDGVEVGGTIALCEAEDETTGISGEELHKKAESKKNTYDIRFYNSLIGKQLDNYRVISLIGAGSMGGVLQGWDVALEREVALKIISFELSSKEEFREMFIKEARLVSKLTHPNIALIYNIGCSNDILYYAMEYIDGITLKDMIRNKGKLNLLKGMALLIATCKAMDAVYEHGIVHRDIKPANIMISKTEMAKIVDFGVAHSKHSNRSKKCQVVGTPLYMSPEQIAGLTLDHRSDMYSLGATFYHAFCGSPPFSANAIKDILDQHLNSTITPLTERNAHMPDSVSAIIEKMLAKDPNDRYQTFKEITQELTMLRSRLIGSEYDIRSS